MKGCTPNHQFCPNTPQHGTSLELKNQDWQSNSKCLGRKSLRAMTLWPYSRRQHCFCIAEIPLSGSLSDKQAVRMAFSARRRFKRRWRRSLGINRLNAKPSRDSSEMICARQFFVLDCGKLLGVLFDTTCIHEMVRNVGLYLPQMKGYVLDWLQDVCTRVPAKHPSPGDIAAHAQPTCCSNI